MNLTATLLCWGAFWFVFYMILHNKASNITEDYIDEFNQHIKEIEVRLVNTSNELNSYKEVITSLPASYQKLFQKA